MPLDNKTALSKSNYFALIAIILSIFFGLHTRYLVNTQTEFHVPIRADAADFYFYAKNLKFENTYSRSQTQPLVSDAIRDPGFPSFASLLYSEDLREFYFRTINTQTFIQVFSFLLLTLYLLKTIGITKTAILSLFLWNFPHFITINIYFLSESIFLSLLVLSFISFDYAINKKDLENERKLFFISGILIGMACITRSIVMYYPVFLTLFMLTIKHDKTRSMIWYLTGSLIFILGWKARNFLIIGESSDPTLLINAIYHGSFPNFMYQNNPETFAFPYKFDPKADQIYSGIPFTLQLIFERAIESPYAYLKWYTYGKFESLWSWDIVQGMGDIFIYPVKNSPYWHFPELSLIHSFNKILHPIILSFTGALTLFQLTKWKSLKRFKPIFPISIVLYISTLNIIIAPFPRYGIPFKVFIFILFSIFIVNLAKITKSYLTQHYLRD
ncbi:MAG: hypothetical protein K6L73_05060 [Cellvibrionaceae bacterium]